MPTVAALLPFSLSASTEWTAREVEPARVYPDRHPPRRDALDDCHDDEHARAHKGGGLGRKRKRVGFLGELFELGG